MIISNRGNLNGRIIEFENLPSYIDKAIELGKFHGVKIDLWGDKGELYLGNDGPLYKIDPNWLIYREMDLWIHARNIDAVNFLNNMDLTWFWREHEILTIASNGVVINWSEQHIRKAIKFDEQEKTNESVSLGIITNYPLSFSY